MKARSFILLLLAILFLAVVLFLNRPQDAAVASYVLPDWELPIDTSKVLKIVLQRERGPVTFERKHGIWRYERGDRVVAESMTITDLLAAIADFRLLGLVSSNPRKQDLFEVGEKGTSIIITTNQGKEVSLIVGKMSSLPHRSYVRPMTSDMVFLASGLTPEVTSGETMGFSGTVFHLDLPLVLSISIETHQSGFTVRKQGRLWFSGQDPIPTRIMRPVMASLQEMRAEGSHGVDVRRGEKPILSLEIQGQGRKRFEFYRAVSNDSRYIMKTSISPRTYFVGINTASPFVQLANFLSSRVYGAPQSKVGSPVDPLSSGSRSTSPPQQSAATRKIFSPQESVTSEQSISPPAGQTVPENTVDTTARGSVEDEGILSVHKVQPGETLESIAQLYNTTKDKLKQWNLLTGDVVPAGVELYVFVRR